MLVQTSQFSVLEEVRQPQHGYEELIEGAWLEPGLALLRKKVREDRTGKHRKEVGRKKKAIRHWMVGYQSGSILEGT